MQLATPIIFLLSLLLACPTLAATREAARQVATGIAKHRSGDFAGAEQAFAAAAQSLPEDPRPAFDQGCALAAQGKHDDAEKQFEQAKLARDPSLSAASLYNLGCLSAERAKAKFGERPEEATPEMRADGLKLVEQAVARYRDCLAVESSHADARHNLELLRLWVKHMQEAWKQRDRDKRRKEMGLLEFLEMLQMEQVSLRGQTRLLAPVADSPRRRQAATLLGQSQRELAEEIKPLQEKLREALQPKPADKSKLEDAPPATPEAEQALAALAELSQQSKSAMSRAATDLVSSSLSTAEESQNQALEPLNEIYRAVAPFEHVLQKAIRVEEELIPTTQSVAELPADDAQQKFVVADLPREQRQVAGWAEVLPAKAQQATDHLKAQPTVAGPPPPPNAAGGTPKPDPAAQREELLAAYGKAIELAPRAHSAAKDAAASLDRQSFSEAKPNQEEALKLLKEIADRLPKQPNQDQQQDQKEDQKKDDQKQDQQNQDQKNQDQKEDSKQKQQPDKSPQDQQKKDQQKKDVSRQQAESLLRQVRERERDYREQQKKRQAVIGGVRVDKDW